MKVGFSPASRARRQVWRKLLPLPTGWTASLRVRTETVLALMNMRHEAAIDLLVQATRDPDREVRLFAIHVLGFHRQGGARARLLEVMRLSNWRGQNSDFIRTAAIALGRHQDSSCLPELQKLSKKRPRLFKKRREDVRGAAMWAVATVEGAEEAAAPDLAQLKGLEAKRTSFFRRQK